MIGRSTYLLLVAVVAAAVTATGVSARTSTPLDGTWTWTWTRDDVGRARAGAYDFGRYTATLANGRATARNLRTGRVRHAKYFVHGNVVGFVFPERSVGVVPGRMYELKWSIYRDRLRFTELPGRSVLTLLPLEPWTRVR